MKYSLKVKDFLKGLLMAVGTPVLLIIQQSIAAGSLTFNWQQIGMVAAAAGLLYLTKNYFTDDVKQAVDTLETAKKKGAEIPSSQVVDLPYSAPKDKTV
jgi:hypothetical protein